MTYQIKKVFKKIDFSSRRPTKVYIIEGEFVKFIVEFRRRDGARQEACKLAGKMSKDNLVQVNQYESSEIGDLISYSHQRQNRSSHSGTKGAKGQDQNICSRRISIQCPISNVDHRHS
jgi:hypothetical protein